MESDLVCGKRAVRRRCRRHAVLLREFVRRVAGRQRDRARRLRRSVHGRSAERARIRRAISSGKIVGGRAAGVEQLSQFMQSHEQDMSETPSRHHRRSFASLRIKSSAMDVIPSIDVLQGTAVRLTRGEFTRVTKYGAPEEVLESLSVEPGARLHVVDLEASRSGHPVETEIVRRLAKRNLRLQVGGGIRSLRDARTWLDCGAERLVIGTAAAETPDLLRQLVDTFGAKRVIPAIDVLEG